MKREKILEKILMIKTITLWKDMMTIYQKTVKLPISKIHPAMQSQREEPLHRKWRPEIEQQGSIASNYRYWEKAHIKLSSPSMWFRLLASRLLIINGLNYSRPS